MATDETSAESGNRVATFDYPVTIAGIFSVVKKDQSNQNAVHQIKAILKTSDTDMASDGSNQHLLC